MKITWKRDGLDLVMFVNGVETFNVISPASGYYAVYFNNELIGIADTIKEAKVMILICGGYK